VTTHTEKTGFKRDTGSGRWLGEDHGHGLTGKGAVFFTIFKARLDLFGDSKCFFYLICGKIGDMQKIPFHCRFSSLLLNRQADLFQERSMVSQEKSCIIAEFIVIENNRSTLISTNISGKVF
jgi:hypothetical protein